MMGKLKFKSYVTFYGGKGRGGIKIFDAWIAGLVRVNEVGRYENIEEISWVSGIFIWINRF